MLDRNVGSVELGLPVTTGAPVTTGVPVTTGLPRRSLWRRWNQLSRLQRSLFMMCLLVLIIIVILVINSKKNKNILVPIALSTPEHVIKVPDQISEDQTLKIQKVEDEKQVEKPKEKEEGKEMPESHKYKVEPIIFKGPTNSRQEAVMNAFKHAWKGYRKFAWGHDHVKPISGTFYDWCGMALTLIDGLDTCYMMGLEEEFNQAIEYLEKLNLDINKEVNVFETTIRALGGLLSAYHLSGKEILLEKAIDLANRLVPSFNTPSGIPFSDVNLHTKYVHAPKWSPDSSTSEVTTIQLEFRDLSRVTGDTKYETLVSRVSDIVHSLPKKNGLVPIFINAHTGQFRQFSTITLGARGDSYYEYLLKQWLQTGKKYDAFKNDYLKAVEGVSELLLKKTKPNGYHIIGELTGGGKSFKNKMDHLTCFLSGTLALGVRNGLPSHHMSLAEHLLSTCYATYKIHPTGLASEITHFNFVGESKNDFYVKSADAHSLLRPETIESLWYLYHFTGNTTYQDWGWQIFQSMEKYARVPNGYTNLGDVRNALDPKPRDMMESFFLAETLKYLYLLFSDDQSQVSLDKWVFNTEGHPLPMYTS